MNINRFCVNLSLGFDLVCPELNQLRQNLNIAKIVSMYASRKDLIDPRLVSFLDQHNIYIHHQEIFYTPARFTSPIHIDHDYTDNHCKLNWVFGAEESSMVWYMPKDITAPLRVNTTVINTKYCVFTKNEVFELHRSSVRTPSLVNAGIPHNIINHTDQDRWCFSCVLSFKGAEKHRIQIADAVKVFSKYTY